MEVKIAVLILTAFVVFLAYQLSELRKRTAVLWNLEAQRQNMEAKGQIKLRCKPDEKCPTCFGRGFIGKDVKTGQFVPCDCCSYPATA